MSISAKLVKELREKSGAGMMDCKKALVEAEGDMDKAVQILKEKGMAKAGKKADRVASEGVVTVQISDDFKEASVTEINSETDFVAKNENFQNLVQKTGSHIHANSIETIEELNSTTIDGVSFEEFMKTQIATIGEKIEVRRFAKIKTDDGVVNGYVHGGGKIGVIIAGKCENSDKCGELKDLLKNLSMHIAAMKPQILSYQEFDPAFVESETIGISKEIEKENEELARLGKPLKNVPQFISKLQLTDEVMANIEVQIKEELKAEGKPEKIWDKILPGKIDRFIADNTLLDQQFALLDQFYALDDKKTVAQVLDEASSKMGKVEIVEFIRFELGDGIEKKEEKSFADEVAEQMGK